MRMIARTALATLLLVAAPAGAELYKWVDDDGTVHFSDRAPDEGAERVELEPINSVAPVDGLEPAEGAADTGERPQAGGGRVTMYSTSWCGYCRRARQYFRAEGIPFTEHDIEASARARRAYNRLGGGGVPLLKVGGRTMNGFSVESFERFYRR